MSILRTSTVTNPITGVFGGGFMQIFGPGMSGTWTVPVGVSACRVRLWGGGGSNTGGGGGFAMKTIYSLAGVSSVAVTVGNASSTSSFGSYVSAGGGTNGSPYTAGSGSGGDINTTGGTGVSAAGGGAASLFGNGGDAGAPGRSSASGGAGNGNGQSGGSGLTGVGAFYSTTATYLTQPIPAMAMPFSIDFLGTGPGGSSTGPGWNGGGGTQSGGFPGGGGSPGAPGLVIVEW